MADGAILKAYIIGKDIKREPLAKSLDVTRQNLYQWYKSKKLKPETKTALEKALKVKWSVIESEGIEFMNDNIDVNVSRENGNAPVNDLQPRGEAYWSKRCLQLFDELDGLRRKGKGVGVNLDELSQELRVTAAMLSAAIEILVVIAGADPKKGVYNKTVEILKKHKLEGSFL